MTAYKDRRFLREAVDAVLAQTLTEFEFIVIDNGSDDPDSIRGLETLDSRIIVHRIEQNAGPGGGGDIGIRMARAPIIARIDSDDRAEAGWLATIVEALDADSELGLVSSWMALMNEQGDPIGIDRTPESDFAIRFTLLSHNPFYHSGAAYRRALYELVGGSAASQHLTHDHYLWRAMLPHCRARNLADPLVNYRYNSQGLTGSADQTNVRARTREIRLALWAELGMAFPLEDALLADEVDAFLRQRPSQHPQIWPQVCLAIEQMIAATESKLGYVLQSSGCAARESYVAGLRAQLALGPIAPPGQLRRLSQAIVKRGLRRTIAAGWKKIAG
jgi:Glycosyl transferase family 2